MQKKQTVSNRFSSENIDMITDSPVRAVLLFAVPVAIGSLFQSLYNTMDSVIIGRFLGARALAAVGSTASITGFFLIISISLTTAFSVMTAQYFGARNYEMVRKTVAGCIYIVAAGSVVIGAAGAIFARPVMTMMLPTTMSSCMCVVILILW